MSAPQVGLAKGMPHSLEAEQAVLGALIENNRWLDLCETLKPDDFYDPVNAKLYERIAAKINAGRLVDPIVLRDMVLADETLKDIGGVRYVLTLVQNAARLTAHVTEYAGVVSATARRRALIHAAREIEAAALRPTDDQTPSDLIARAGGLIDAVAQGAPAGAAWKRIGDITVSAVAEAKQGRATGVSTGLVTLDNYIGGLRKRKLITIAGATSMGKAQPLDANVLLANGEWRAMGDLQIGDSLASVDGQASTVLSLHPQPKQAIYRVTLSDGRTCEATAEHLWQVSSAAWARKGGPLFRVVTTVELARLIAMPTRRNRIWIDPPSGAFGEERDLGIDPWLLGAWIGDGTGGVGRTFQITTASSTIEARLRECARKAGVGVRLSNRYHFGFCGQKGGRANPLTMALRELDLFSCTAERKFIPRECFSMTERQRLELMRGLMDTDGWVETFGCVRFATVSEQLADDVAELARSLGCWASRKDKPNSFYTHKGERRRGRPVYLVSIAGRADLFSEPAKLARCSKRQRTKRLNVKEIVARREAVAQCITVSHPTKLYITDDYTPTHNSILAQQIAINVAAQGKGVAYFHLEMDAFDIGLRTSSALAFDPERVLGRAGYGNPFYLSASRQRLFPEQWERLEEGARRAAELPIWVDDTPGRTVAQIEANARQAFREMAALGIEPYLLVVDHQGLISPDRHYNSELEESFGRAKLLKDLPKKLDVCVPVLAQITKAGSRLDGTDELPQSTDIKYGGALIEASDAVLLIHREAYYAERKAGAARTPEEDDKAASRTATIMVDKARGGQRGQVEIIMDTPTAAVYEEATR